MKQSGIRSFSKAERKAAAREAVENYKRWKQSDIPEVDGEWFKRAKLVPPEKATAT